MHDILYREVSPVNFNSQPKKMHRKQGACISKNALCLLTSKTSVVRDCAARGAAIYGAEGICKFICDMPSETYMTDIQYRAQARSRNVTLYCSAYYTPKGNELHIPDLKHKATYGSSAAKILR